MCKRSIVGLSLGFLMGCSRTQTSHPQPVAAGTSSVAGTAAPAGVAGTSAVSTGAAGTSGGLAGNTAIGSAGTLAFAGSAGVSSGGVAGSAAISGSGGAAGDASAAGTSAVAGSSAGSSAAGAGGSSGPAEGCPAMPLGSGDHTFMINSANGLMYSYIISVPTSVDPNKRSPVVVHWHALSSDPTEARSVTSVDAKAQATATIMVYPISPDKSWDTGSCCTSTVGGKPRDEEVFARELIKDVETKVCVDTHRIYTNGFSNGGMMSQMLACKMADVFAASAPMGSTLTIAETDCTPSRPIPIFMINGTADPLVGYNAPGFAGGISVPDDVKFWAMKNQCTGSPEMLLQKGKATCQHYTQCAAGAEVAFCSIDGMGHCVPGMKTESPTNCLTKSGIALGMPNDDIDAIQMDFDFLERFTLP